MDAIKKQASRLREQVAKQQQAVLKHLGHFGNETVMIDEAELQCHQQLENLYNSTRAAKHFQRNIVRGIEGFISTSLKQMEIVRKLSEDCRKYGTENQSTNPRVARAALCFGTSHNSMESERETLLGILGQEVSEPLRALITGAPLEDARHLTHRYDKLRQEVEAQAAEVLKRRLKTRENDISAESCVKLRSAEARLTELKSTMIALGKEAIAAMLSVEDQQQQMTFQRLFTMVDAERTYHRHAIAILDKLCAEMMTEEQSNESSPQEQSKKSSPQEQLKKSSSQLKKSSSQSMTMQRDAIVPCAHENTDLNGSDDKMHANQNDEYFIAKVIHPFDAQAEGELSLSVDDYVVVRQVAPHGWSEGECEGKAGWFPSAYIEMQDKAPASKMMDSSSTQRSSIVVDEF